MVEACILPVDGREVANIALSGRFDMLCMLAGGQCAIVAIGAVAAGSYIVMIEIDQQPIDG